MKKLTLFLLVVFIGMVFSLAGCKVIEEAPPEEKVVLRFTSPPDPNLIPASVLLEQKPLAGEGIELEFIPSQGASDIMVHLQRGDVDIALYSTPGGAKMYATGITNIRLVGVHVWKSIYVVAEKDVSDWEDLKGKDVYIDFQGGPPDIIARASMKAEGYDPDKDFNIKYLPGSEIKMLILSGQADAAVFPEPHISQLVLKSEGRLHMAIDCQEGFVTSIPDWERGEEIPLGALWIVAPNIEDKKEAVEKFIDAFDKANVYVMNHPKEAGNFTSKCFKQYFGSEFPAKAVEDSITSGRLELDFRGVEDVKPLMPSYLESLGFPVPGEGIYYEAEVSLPQETRVKQIRDEIKTIAEGEIIKYQQESFYSSSDFSLILDSEDEFKEMLIKEFKDKIIGVTAENCKVDLNQSKKSVILECGIIGARYGRNSYNMHFLLNGTTRFGFDLYGFEPKLPPYGKKLSFDGEINGIPTKIVFEFPYELSHCHEHVWPR